MEATKDGKLAFINELMDKMSHISILKRVFEVLKIGVGFKLWISAKSSKLTAYVIKEWILYICACQLKAPPQYLDSKVIENLWSHLKKYRRSA
ncbi:hypothetical protein TNCT_329671 [Trichonephila clavata]|uniref:Transposase n=1 Tax=Trichonephila clavata TaxID=2740835 RepID=A0A8X6LKA2_TRICU|nr:hypothetical protein TNCT_329671 [Trichonephila clavata]